MKKDAVEGVKWIRKAAEKGFAPAQSNLGLCYDKGIGVQKDDAEAAKWYLKAAEKGDLAAQNNLGFCYEKGLGVKKDASKAVHWYMRASQQGDSLALTNLGDCLRSGQGVKKDLVEAYARFVVAESDHPRAKEYLKQTAVEMSPEQIAKGSLRAKQLMEQIRKTTLEKAKPVPIYEGLL